jgi:charged multivesicular body protein 1
MEKFESQFEDLDVQVQVMDGAMSSTSVMSTPEGEVNGLMQEVADAHGTCFWFAGSLLGFLLLFFVAFLVVLLVMGWCWLWLWFHIFLT